MQVKSALIVVLAVSTIVQAGPPKKAKTPQLAKAVSAANALLEPIIENDRHAKQIIEDEKPLDGRFAVRIKITKVTKSELGASIFGTFTVKHPDQARYRTEAEVEKIAKAADKLESMKKENSGKIKSAGMPSRDSPQGRADARRRAAKARIEASKKEDKLVKELAKVKREVEKAEAARRAECETVTIIARADAGTTKLIDMAAALKGKSFNAVVSVSDFKLDQEPAEIGGKIIVKEISADILAVEAATKSTAAAN